MTAADVTPGPQHRWVLAVTALLQIAAFAPYLLSGLVAPPWGVLAMRGLWVGLSVFAFAWGWKRPVLSLVVPPATFALGFVCLFLGGSLLGWQG